MVKIAASEEMPQWSTKLQLKDLKEIIELSQLPCHELHAQIQKLLKTVYDLGIMESREIIRGKYLGIYVNCKKRIQ